MFLSRLNYLLNNSELGYVSAWKSKMWLNYLLNNSELGHVSAWKKYNMDHCGHAEEVTTEVAAARLEPATFGRETDALTSMAMSDRWNQFGKLRISLERSNKDPFKEEFKREESVLQHIQQQCFVYLHKCQCKIYSFNAQKLNQWYSQLI